MDVGIFKASKIRLIGWIVVPPILIVTVGLSSYALRQRAEWRLKETRALSDVLPDVVHARRDIKELYDHLGLSKDKRITSGDQLINILEETARERDIELKRTQIVDREATRGSRIPTTSVIMEAAGGFDDFQLFLNDVKTAYPLVSARSIFLSEDEDNPDNTRFELKVVFDLLLVADVLKASGDTI